MRSVTLSKPLDPAISQAVGWLLDLPTGLVDDAWWQVRWHGDYRSFRLGSGSGREVHEPSGCLHTIQDRVLTKVLHTGPVSPAAHPGVKGRSFLEHARRHLAADRHVLAVDIRDAFGSTTYWHVSSALRDRLRKELWILGLDREGSNAVAGVLAYFLSCRRGNGPGRRLPLGAATSVALFNLVCLALDTAICRQLPAPTDASPVTYTRYVDDLVFSRPEPFDQLLLGQIERLVQEHGYGLNEDKTQHGPAQDVTVCGLRRTPAEIEPAPALRARLAQQIQLHLEVTRDSSRPAGERHSALLGLRSLDGFLRRIYEGQGLPRPDCFVFVIPEVLPDPRPPVLDLLWPRPR